MQEVVAGSKKKRRAAGQLQELRALVFSFASFALASSKTTRKQPNEFISNADKQCFASAFLSMVEMLAADLHSGKALLAVLLGSMPTGLS